MIRHASLLVAFAFSCGTAAAYCNKVGGTCQHSGVWNVYASMPGGDAWADDYVGEKPATLALQTKAEDAVRGLAQCGIAAEITNSSWVSGFRRDLVIVLSGPYASKAAAAGDLAAARNCGITGYSKRGVWNEPGAE